MAKSVQLHQSDQGRGKRFKVYAGAIKAQKYIVNIVWLQCLKSALYSLCQCIKNEAPEGLIKFKVSVVHDTCRQMRKVTPHTDKVRHLPLGLCTELR